MRIKRMIGNEEVEIELTSHELYDAFCEQEHLFDMDNVRCHFDAFDDDDLMNSYNMTREEIAKLIDPIAWELRRMMNKYDCSFEGALYDAIDKVMEESS